MPDIEIIRSDTEARETDYDVRDDTASRGVDLAGSEVTVTYADGTIETLTWEAYDPYTNGGATGSDVDMSFGYDWHHLTTTKLVKSIEIDLAPANSAFDTTFTLDSDPAGGSTIGSKNGFPFKLASDDEDLEGKITASYSGVVNQSGNEAAGDLYTTLTIDFTGLPGGGLLGDLSWNSDIDTFEGPFTVELEAVDDTVILSDGTTETINVLDNDHHDSALDLKITKINGEPIAAGESVTLSTGEVITLNDDGTLTISNDSDVAETNSFTYTVEDEDGTQDQGSVTIKTKFTTPPCFVAGTLIETEHGPIPVEELEVGTLVHTRDRGLQPLRWTGRSERTAVGRDAPVVLCDGALGDHAAIALSPNHRVLVVSERAELQFGQSEVLVQVKHLVNGATIKTRADGAPVTYVHLLFDQHEIICANGLETESYHPGEQSLDAFESATRAEIISLFPELATYGPTARLSLRGFEGKIIGAELVPRRSQLPR